MNSLVCGLSLVVFTLPSAIAQSSSKTPIDNEQLRVSVVEVQPHVKTNLHDHTLNRVMVYLQAGKQDFDYQGGKKSVLEWKAGEAKWSPAAGMHIADLVSAKPVTIVEIFLKKAVAGSVPVAKDLDPVAVDPRHYKLEFENDQVRVVRVKIGAREVTPLHTHGLERVTTYLTEQDFQVTGADGHVDHVQHKAGEVVWGTPISHREENLSSKPFEAVMTELKKSSGN